LPVLDTRSEGVVLETTPVALPHGSFLPWIEAEFEMSAKTAQKFMSVAESYGGKNELGSNLSLSALYELAAPSTPPQVRSSS
jgi:DUF3102 family protein